MAEQESEHLEPVTALFIKWGAEKSQAEVMARQLLKRAGQIAAAHEISEVDALENLLKQVLEARQSS
ncbi:MAG: hypothetical protein ACPG3X_01470 [Opitutales bacterium]